MNGEPVELTYVGSSCCRATGVEARSRVQPAGAARRALGRLAAIRARSTFMCATCARSFEPTPSEPRFILTVRGVGYRFRDA